MGKTFKNEAELKKFLLDKCKVAVAQAENKVYAIIKKFVIEFYRDYDPVLYERTNQLLYSLVKSNIKQTNNGYEAEVYFDLDELQYAKFGWQRGNAPTGEEVFEAAKQGLHGAIGDAGGGWSFRYVDGNNGVNIWYDPIQELDAKAIDTLVDMLKAQGIPIK